MQKMPNCTASESQSEGEVARGTRGCVARVGYARRVPNINGPMNAGSCKLGKTTDTPAADGEEGLVGGGGGSVMVAASVADNWCNSRARSAGSEHKSGQYTAVRPPDRQSSGEVPRVT